MQITRAAMTQFVECRSRQGLNASFVPWLSGVGQNVTLDFQRAPGRDDALLADDDQVIYVAPDAAKRLKRATIDARDEGGKTILVIRERWLAPPSAYRLQ